MNAVWTVVAFAAVVVVGRAFAAVETAAAALAPDGGWSATVVVALCVGIAGILSAAAAGAVRVIRALNEGNVLMRETKRIVVAGQVAAVAANVVSAGKQQEIHLLVNSQLLVRMRANLILLKREYERTKKDSDREACQIAETELRDAEAGAITVTRQQATSARDDRASAARAELEAGQARAGEAPDADARWILALEHIVALAKESAERTRLPADQADYRLAQDNLAHARKVT